MGDIRRYDPGRERIYRAAEQAAGRFYDRRIADVDDEPLIDAAYGYGHVADDRPDVHIGRPNAVFNPWFWLVAVAVDVAIVVWRCGSRGCCHDPRTQRRRRLPHPTRE